MKARPLLDERHSVADSAFIEAVVWEVPKALPGSTHAYKYRLALVIEGRCVLRYDNEAGRVIIGTSAIRRCLTPSRRLVGYSMISMRTWRGG